MNIQYRNALSANELNAAAHGSYLPAVTTSDIRNNPGYHQPVTGFDFPRDSPDMDKPETNSKKRRGGSRKACDECKQQKVCDDCVSSLVEFSSLKEKKKKKKKKGTVLTFPF